MPSSVKEHYGTSKRGHFYCGQLGHYHIGMTRILNTDFETPLKPSVTEGGGPGRLFPEVDHQKSLHAFRRNDRIQT
jgi:hypothetical protein